MFEAKRPRDNRYQCFIQWYIRKPHIKYSYTANTITNTTRRFPGGPEPSSVLHTAGPAAACRNAAAIAPPMQSLSSTQEGITLTTNL